MIEELAARILGVNVDDGGIWETLDEKMFDEFGIELDQLEHLVNKLLPLCEVGVSPLSGTTFCGFADRETSCWIMKVERK